MLNMGVLIGSQNENIISLCEEIATELTIAIQVEKQFEDFLLAIQENDFNVIALDLELIHLDCLKMIRLIKHIRPKIPLIIFTETIDKTLGGKLYSEGIFQLILSPPDQQTLRSVFLALTKDMHHLKMNQ